MYARGFASAFCHANRLHAPKKFMFVELNSINSIEIWNDDICMHDTLMSDIYIYSTLICTYVYMYKDLWMFKHNYKINNLCCQKLYIKINVL